jgi:hypothetical protein
MAFAALEVEGVAQDRQYRAFCAVGSQCFNFGTAAESDGSMGKSDCM